MKIYVLSLKDSTRRNNFSQDNFFLDGLYTFFDAVEGKLLTDDYIHNINKSTSRYNRIIGRNEIACADSHIAIYQNMIEKKLNGLLFLKMMYKLTKNYWILLHIKK
ncbi:glycosyltransferase family 25 protein [Providencia rettgeri]